MDDEGNIVSHIKTPVSQRKIPIHSELLRLGFMEFLKVRKKQNTSDFLFPEMTPYIDTENRGKVFSQWYGRLRDLVLGEGTGTNFHSFRHMISDKLRRNVISDEMRYALLGWTEEQGKRNSGWNYGLEKFPMEDRKAIIEYIDYPDLDLTFLYPEKSKGVRKRTRKNT